METDENETRPFHLILPHLCPGLALPQLGPGWAPRSPGTPPGTEAYPAGLLLSQAGRQGWAGGQFYAQVQPFILMAPQVDRGMERGF